MPTSIATGLQSGLKTLKRDWSESDSLSESTNFQAHGLHQNEEASSSQNTKPAELQMSPRSKRMAAIQAALDGASVASQTLQKSIKVNTLTGQQPGTPAGDNGPRKSSAASSLYSLKRNSPDHRDNDEVLEKKKRMLPNSFLDQTALRTATVQVSKPVSSRGGSSSSSGIKVVDERRREGGNQKANNGPAKLFLSKEQQKILELVEGQCSIFYTGSAGTGKSVLLREIIKTLRKKHKVPDAVAITASTGIAACNIGGVTVHSFAGIGLGIEQSEQLVSKIRKNKRAMSRWLRTKVLIIDEVSMLDGDLFDKLAEIGGKIKKNNIPFGGIQIIVTGDFFQLPPVMKGSDPKFAFEAKYWSETIKEHTYNLTKVFRQKDENFVNMLNEMRFGQLSQQSILKFKSLSREIRYDDGMGPTELFPRREDVDRSNGARMQHLNTQQQVYRAKDGGLITDTTQRDKMLANFMAPASLTLKVDCQVMLIKNMDETLVNGSMGRVIGFMDPAQAKDETARPPNSEKENAKKRTPSQLWPVVAFPIPGGYVKEVMIAPEVFKVELPNGEVQVSRTQLPLILAWAMSIHKSQGQTLERVKVDLGKVFEKGQAYVALSRATSLEGLQVLNFDAKKVNAHPKVVKWSKTLQSIQ